MAGKKLRGGGRGKGWNSVVCKTVKGRLGEAKKRISSRMEVYNYAASCIHHVHTKYTILPVNTAETSLAEESKDGYISKL